MRRLIMAKYKTKRELIQIKDDEKINEGAGEGSYEPYTSDIEDVMWLYGAKNVVIKSL
jgi:hypothetical protein